jgi:rRNA maturation RNase YbeY
MAKFNAQYRHKPGATDILGFAFHKLPSPEAFPTITDPHEKDFGDLVVSAEYVMSVKEPTPWDELLTHGFTHLLGYDHETEADYAIMHAKEEEFIAALRRER